MTTQNLGMSKRSLLLLGGLTAALTNASARQKLLDAVSGAADSAQATYQGTVRPLAHQAQAQLQAGVQDIQARTQELAHMAAERGTELAHVAAERGAEFAQVAAERGADLAQVAAKRGTELASQGTEVAAGVASLAAERGGQLAVSVRENVSELRETGGRQVHGLLGNAQDTLKDARHTLDDVRKDGGRLVDQKVRQGRRQAMKLQKELGREVTVRGRGLEKLSGKKLRQAEKELAELKKRGAKVQKAVRKTADQRIRRVRGQPEPGFHPVVGVLIVAGVLAAGGVLLARVPAVRHSILKAVGSVSPEAADALKRAGTTVRDLVGSVWLERIEPEVATQAPAPKDSLATGSAAGASVEPGAPAQAVPPAPESKSAEENVKN